MGACASVFRRDEDLEQMYDLQRMVRAGLEGQVWLARCRKTDCAVSIRLTPRGVAVPGAGLEVERLRRELQLLARLSHPNLVELRQVVLTGRHLAVVMSHEPGGDLKSYCARFPLNEKGARYFFRQILSAVDYCHRLGVTHRDLRLSSFMMVPLDPPRIKLADSGCAATPAKQLRAKRLLDKARKAAGALPGGPSPPVAPEALGSFAPLGVGRGATDDVWACGLLLCQIVMHDPTLRFTPDPHAPRGRRGGWRQSVADHEAAAGGSGGDLAARVAALSPELQDLLDSIFMDHPEERITLQGIMRHPWTQGHCGRTLQAALDRMEGECAARERLHRAAVSVGAGRYELQRATAGGPEFATLDAAVRMASQASTPDYVVGPKRRGKPAGDGAIVIELAHAEADDGGLAGGGWGAGVSADGSFGARKATAEWDASGRSSRANEGEYGSVAASSVPRLQFRHLPCGALVVSYGAAKDTTVRGGAKRGAFGALIRAASSGRAAAGRSASYGAAGSPTIGAGAGAGAYGGAGSGYDGAGSAYGSACSFNNASSSYGSSSCATGAPSGPLPSSWSGGGACDASSVSAAAAAAVSAAMAARSASLGSQAAAGASARAALAPAASMASSFDDIFGGALSSAGSGADAARRPSLGSAASHAAVGAGRAASRDQDSTPLFTLEAWQDASPVQSSRDVSGRAKQPAAFNAPAAAQHVTGPAVVIADDWDDLSGDVTTGDVITSDSRAPKDQQPWGGYRGAPSSAAPASSAWAATGFAPAALPAAGCSSRAHDAPLISSD